MVALLSVLILAVAGALTAVWMRTRREVTTPPPNVPSMPLSIRLRLPRGHFGVDSTRIRPPRRRLTYVS